MTSAPKIAQAWARTRGGDAGAARGVHDALDPLRARRARAARPARVPAARGRAEAAAARPSCASCRTATTAISARARPCRDAAALDRRPARVRGGRRPAQLRGRDAPRARRAAARPGPGSRRAAQGAAPGRSRHVHRRPQHQLHQRVHDLVPLLRVLPAGRPRRGLRAHARAAHREDQRDGRGRRHPDPAAGRAQSGAAPRVVRGSVPLDEGDVPDQAARAQPGGDLAPGADRGPARSKTCCGACARRAWTRCRAAAPRC